MLRVAPARPFPGCAGVSVFLLVLSLSGCKDSVRLRDEKLDIGSDTIQLAPGVSVHDVQVRTHADGEFEPANIKVRTGDVIRFKTTDARTHVLSFDETTLPPQVRDHLVSHAQLRSPPLLVEGAVWIVSLADVPHGEYSIHCQTHGVAGRITVE